MKTLQSFLLILTISFFTLNSCQTNESIIDNQDPATESIALRTVLNQLKVANDISTGRLTTSRTPNDSINFCFDFVYPFQLEYNTGAQVTVESFEGLIQILINETNDLYITGIVMPFDLVLADGTTVTINNEQDFIDVIESCEFDVWDDDDVIVSCFEFVYPFDMIDSDGNTVTITSEDGLMAFFESQDQFYYEPIFVFPITVINSDGEEVIINNIYEFFELTDDCYDCNCYEIYEPICVLDPITDEIIEFDNDCYAICEGYTPNDFVNCDGTDCNIFDMEVTVGDCIDTESYSIILNFEYTGNPTDSLDVVLGNEDMFTRYALTDLPLTLTIPSEPYYNFLEVMLSDTCSSYTQWDALNCSGNFDFMDYVGGNCFDFVYPFQITYNGMTIWITHIDSLSQYFNPGSQAEIIFPVQINVFATNETLTINSMDELEAVILENCN
jgi:hypothetical protein